MPQQRRRQCPQRTGVGEVDARPVDTTYVSWIMAEGYLAHRCRFTYNGRSASSLSASAAKSGFRVRYGLRSCIVGRCNARAMFG